MSTTKWGGGCHAAEKAAGRHAVACPRVLITKHAPSRRPARGKGVFGTPPAPRRGAEWVAVCLAHHRPPEGCRVGRDADKGHLLMHCAWWAAAQRMVQRRGSLACYL